MMVEAFARHYRLIILCMVLFDLVIAVSPRLDESLNGTYWLLPIRWLVMMSAALLTYRARQKELISQRTSKLCYLVAVWSFTAGGLLNRSGLLNSWY
ncbi:MAG: hypothetical protein H6918_01945 [Sphingomonadaceae bacterium]|nr:hypothetical protein [Sphingomonadaceae bacterium]